jgi:hypothetical protein
VSANTNLLGGDLLPCNLNFTPGAQLITCQNLLQVLGEYLSPSKSAASRTLPSLARAPKLGGSR